MHVHVIQLLVILVLAILGIWANKSLNATASQKWVTVGIGVVAVLFALMSLGVINNPGVTVNP